MAEMRTQKAEILNWLQRIGYITPKDAIALCGCYRAVRMLSTGGEDLRAESRGLDDRDGEVQDQGRTLGRV